MASRPGSRHAEPVVVATGLKALTGETNLSGAWQKILPDYQTGEIIAIKVNFNDSIMGGGSSGYADNDAYVDALPQIINSIVSGLTEMGVRQSDIWVYDASRYITDRFRARIAHEDIQYFDRYGNGASVQATTFDSTDPAANVDFSGTSYSGAHQVTDILVEADYLINMPIMKRHGGAGSDIPDPNPPEDPPSDPPENPSADPEPNENNPTDSGNDSSTSEGCFVSCLR